jgi:hypothetical protein
MVGWALAALFHAGGPKTPTSRPSKNQAPGQPGQRSRRVSDYLLIFRTRLLTYLLATDRIRSILYSEGLVLSLEMPPRKNIVS